VMRFLRHLLRAGGWPSDHSWPILERDTAPTPALCTVCDARLSSVGIRSCSILECPHAARDAA
jgi:hypothetical protein